MTALEIVGLVAVSVNAALAPVGAGHLAHIAANRRHARRRAARPLPVSTPWQYEPPAFTRTSTADSAQEGAIS